MLIRRPIRAPEVGQILAMAEPVRRNLWITLAYHDLAGGMTSVIGSRNLSWVAFATWASKTAGVSIRGEQLQDLLGLELERSPGYRRVMLVVDHTLALVGREVDLDGIVIPIFTAAIQRMSTLIAEGNRTVFDELGSPFARMIETFDGDPTFDGAKLQVFLDTVHAFPGGHPDATRHLREAFRLYYASRFVADERERAEGTLLANALIGLSEQVRLQPAILGALNALIDVGLADLLRETLGVPLPDILMERLAREVQRIWRRVATQLLLTLKTPLTVLDLSEDVPFAEPGQQFPAELRTITAAALQEFLLEYDLTNGVGRPSGADDWADLADRMNYIVNLFRAWQHQAPFLLSPFSDEQISALQAGQIPSGPL